MNQLLSVVIPVYNEGEGIAHAIQQISKTLVQANIPHEFVLVDDGSRDHSWDELLKLAKGSDNILSVKLSRNFGKEAALCAGLDHAKGACCLCMDSDLQHPPEIIPEMYRLWKDDGVEVVEGIKKHRGRESISYKLSAKIFYQLLKKTSGINLENASDFRLLDRVAVEAWKSLPERSTFFRGMSTWIGFSRAQVSFVVAPRENGSTKWSFFRLARLGLSAITSFSAAPLYLSATIGCAFLFLFVLLLGWTLYMKFMGIAADGFTTVISLQLIVGGLLLLSVGVIGIYLEKIYEEVKGRPRYLIHRVVARNPTSSNSIVREG
jgi:dolichol-phosphate mannosyltransferase